MIRKIIAVDLSKAYLLARYNFEGRKAIGDEWLSKERRARVGTLYISIGNDFNSFLKKLHNVKSPKLLYALSVKALEIFRDNLDIVWIYAYSGELHAIKWLSKTVKKTPPTCGGDELVK